MNLWLDLTVDKFVRIGSGGEKYMVNASYQVVREELNMVDWHKLTWHNVVVPRCSVCTWKLMLNRLATQDMIKKRGTHLALRCELCKTHVETLEHLFMNC